MEGVLYGYNGVEWSAATDKGIVGSRSEVGLAYQEICQPDAFRSYCASGAPWCGRTDSPSSQQEQAHGFYAAAGPALRRAVMRCGPKNIFKRSADALLIDIGINDVGFASWAAGIILQDPLLRSAASAMTPCFDGTARCASTRDLFARLDNRYGLLRTVLDQYMLPDFGIDPSHVIVAVYPPALENESGVFCPQGNAGLTIGTLPSFLEAHCGGSVALGGVLAQYPKSDQVERDVEQARVKLNESLDPLERVARVPDLPAARLARLPAKTAGKARRLLQPLARRRLRAVGAVLPQLPSKLSDFHPQGGALRPPRFVLTPHPGDLSPKRLDQPDNLGRTTHPYFNSRRPSSCRAPSRGSPISHRTCGNSDWPLLGSYPGTEKYT